MMSFPLSVAARRRIAAVLLAVAAGVAAAPAAVAQDADALLGEGKKLMKEGKLGEACPKLEESQRIAPKASTLLEVAACHEKQGKIATAWAEYLDVAGLARKDGNKRLETDAKGRGAKLELRIPRLTIQVPQAVAVEGFELKIDGTAIERTGWGQARPTDPGEHIVSASAPGKKPWESRVTIKVAERKGIKVPALADDPNGAAAAPTPTPAPGPKPAGQGAQAPAKGPAAAPAGPAPETPEPEPPQPTSFEGGRLVVDVGVVGGGLLGVIETGGLGNFASYTYSYLIPEGELIQACTEETCKAAFDSAFGGMVGGQLFLGWAVSPELHIGVRGFGAYRFGGGYALMGGPGGALRVGPVWLGLTLLVGGVSQSAPVTGVKGEVPAEFVDLNQGRTEVDVSTVGKSLPEEATVSTLAFGGCVEVSFPIVDLPRADGASGSVMLSAWPGFMKGIEGLAVTLPVGLGYRFH